MLEVLIRVFTSDMPRGTLSTCRSDTPILGSGQVRLYPFDTLPTPAAEPPEVSTQPVPPGVTQEDVPIPPGAKDPLTGVASEKYRDVLPLPLAGMFTGWTGRPEAIGGGEDPNYANEEGGSQWEMHPGLEASAKEEEDKEKDFQ